MLPLDLTAAPLQYLASGLRPSDAYTAAQTEFMRNA